MPLISRVRILGGLCVLLALCPSTMAFAFQPLSLPAVTPATAPRCCGARQAVMMADDASIPKGSRRHLLFGAASLALGTLPLRSQAADAAADIARIKAGYATLVDLLDNWEKYAGKGEEANGDNVRRQVGTVGNKSPLFGIRKVLLRQGVDIDLFESFDKAYTAIDADAYSAIFADASVAPKRGYQYMADSKEATKECLRIYKEIMDSLSIPYE